MASQLNASETLRVGKKAKFEGIEMGVLTDGTPYLNQRSLARLCGVDPATINTLSAQWGDAVQPPRVAAIKDLLTKHGVAVMRPHFEALDGAMIVAAYSDVVCLAILEYYAFDSKEPREEARDNYRRLAGQALHDYIYKHVGYKDPSKSNDPWQHYRDRKSLSYNACPKGYFSVFNEIAELIITFAENGIRIDDRFIPDISVGLAWGSHWTGCGLEITHGPRLPFEQPYPPYYRQAKHDPHHPWCYPVSALGPFRTWFEDIYVGAGKLEKYLATKVRQQQIPAIGAKLALAACNDAIDIATKRLGAARRAS